MTKKDFIYLANHICQISDEKERQIILDFCLSVLPNTTKSFNSVTFKKYIAQRT
jgi:hypothetical protein